MIRGVGKIDSRPEINLPIRRNIEIDHGKDLLRLLRRGIEICDRPESSVVFDAARDLSREIKTHFHIRRKFPPLARIETVQGPVKRGIEGEIPAPKLLIDDGTKLVIPAVLRKLSPLIANFLRKAQSHRQVPRLGSREPRPNVIAHPVPAVAVLNAGEDIKAGLEPVRPALRDLERFVLGMIGWGNAIDDARLARSISSKRVRRISAWI